jgi:glyoxylase-like metal-dependent hydrolase (beta-lactamase superfamily II)
MSAWLWMALAAAAAAEPDRSPLPAPSQGVELTQIGEDYYAYRHLGARTIFLITKAGVILADPLSAEAATAVRAEIAKLTDRPVKYVVYSHEHWDHIRGARIFKDEGATIVSHEKCMARLEDLPNADVVLPDFTFRGARHDLKLGGRTLELHHLGVNHGECMLVMKPAHVNVPFIVDLVTAGGMPLPHMPDYSLHHWVRSLKELEGWGFTQWVGGHGIVLSPTARIAERREYLETLLAATRRELDAGTPQDKIPEAVAERLAPRFRHLRNYDAYVRDNVRRVLTYYSIGW